MKLRVLLLLLVSGFLLTSCKKDKTNSGELDSQLEDLLTQASGGSGSDFFTMPSDGQLDKIPQDPNNPLTPEKVELGRMLYHETALSIHPKKPATMGTYSCASCHFAQGGFAACKPQAIGDGGMGFGETGEARIPTPLYTEAEVDVQPLKTPASLNTAYQELMLWNGMLGGVGANIGTEANWPGTPAENNAMGFEGLETQAIAGIKIHRMGIDPTFIDTTEYKALFDAAFPDVDVSERYTRKYAGLAVAAFERTLLANGAPFQKWLKGDKSAMTDKEKEGAILFFGKAGCVQCHTGPALNSMTFYAYGMNDLYLAPGVLRPDPNADANLGRGGFTGKAEDMYKFKTPQLYNLADSPWYGHGSSFHSIREVIEYKNNAVPQNTNVPPAQLADAFQPLNLTSQEIDALTEFIKKGLYDDNLMRYTPSQLPSGNCFPNNDPLSKIDLGCN